MEINFKTHFRKTEAHSAIILCEQTYIKWPSPFESLNVFNLDCLSPLLNGLSVEFEPSLTKWKWFQKSFFKHLQIKCKAPVIFVSPKVTKPLQRNHMV